MHCRKGAAAACLLIVCIIGLCIIGYCHAELVLVYSIQRHGARNVLPKTSVLTESEAAGGPTLLPEGRKQCLETGRAFRRRYLNPATCNVTMTCLAANRSAIHYGVAGTPGVGFSNYNTVANTSALDRTIMSADSFLLGVFQSTAEGADTLFVPVYSVADLEDWKIRGYTKCPAYQQRLEQWYSSNEFKAKEQQTAAFRSSIQQLVPWLNTSLANWWNVYDAFTVWRNYKVGDEMPGLSSEDYSKTVELAMWLETSKMAPGLTANLLGGGLLGDVLLRITAAQEAISRGSRAYYRLLSVSSHYNAQLGLLAALQSGAQQQTDYLWRHQIPNLAAVLAFELHVDQAAVAGNGASSGAFAVRAVYQDGSDTAYAVLPLPCAEEGDSAETLAGPGSCTLLRFMALAGPQALNHVGDWCEACSNDKLLACAVAKMERQLRAVGIDPTSITTDAEGIESMQGRRVGGTSRGVIAAWCVLSVAVAGIVASVVGFAAHRVRKLKQRKRLIQQAELAMSPSSNPYLV